MEQHAHHPASIKTYLLVFLGLSILTGMTVALSYAGLSHGVGIAAAIAIAATKCTLIATFFMHLKNETRNITLMMLTGLVLVGFLLLAIIPDVGLINK